MFVRLHSHNFAFLLNILIWNSHLIFWYIMSQCSFHVLNFLIWQINFKSPSSYFGLKSASRGLLNQHFCIFTFWIFIFSFEMMYLRVAGQVCLLGHKFPPIELSSALTPSHFIQQRASSDRLFEILAKLLQKYSCDVCYINNIIQDLTQ